MSNDQEAGAGTLPVRKIGNSIGGCGTIGLLNDPIASVPLRGLPDCGNCTHSA